MYLGGEASELLNGQKSEQPRCVTVKADLWQLVDTIIIRLFYMSAANIIVLRY